MKLEVGMYVRFKRGFILASQTTRIAKLIENLNDSEFQKGSYDEMSKYMKNIGYVCK